MSAYLVSDKHLSAIITWAIDNGLLGVLTPQAWFKEFYTENVKSLKERYPNDYAEMIWWNLLQKKYRPVMGVITQKRTRENAIATIKLIDCYMYQSCEHEESKTSLAFANMEHIREQAKFVAQVTDSDLENSLVYDEAPWDYRPQEWSKFIKEIRS